MTGIKRATNAMETLIEDIKDKMRFGVYPDSFILDGANAALAALREKVERENAGIGWLTPILTDQLLSILPICKGCDGKTADGVCTDKCEFDRIPARKCVDRAAALIKEWAERENGCDACTGILYRQTASGKIVPALGKCCIVEPPPCFQKDGENGCAYQVPDGDDEPLEICKQCPLCYGDKMRKLAGVVVAKMETTTQGGAE